MRRLFRSVLALVALAAGLPGCSKSEEARAPAPPPSPGDKVEAGSIGAVSEVTLRVPGMT